MIGTQGVPKVAPRIGTGPRRSPHARIPGAGHAKDAAASRRAVRVPMPCRVGATTFATASRNP